jgi:hypothetical protein
MPNTIAQNLARLVAARTDIANAITAKGGTVTSGDGFEEFPADIATIPSGGGGSVRSKAVNFYGYDGTIVHSYTADEFAELTELPSNPTHEGLTAQGWNWTLANAKIYVSKYGKLNIGQMYVTSDGKTRLYIHLTKGRTTPNFQLYLNANTELDIDWGDGSAHSTFSSTSAGYKDEYHTYPETDGDYVIAVTVISGGFDLQSSSTNVSSILWDRKNNPSSPDKAYTNSIQQIEIGKGVESIRTYAFRGCYSLSNVTIPDGITSIGENAFQFCYSLTKPTIPVSVTSIEGYAFYGCSSLSSVVIPDSVTSIEGYAFRGCNSLSSVVIPDSVTSIEENAFYGCSSLSSVVIPDSVTSIEGYAFYGCYSLTKPTIPDSVTSIEGYAFYGCGSLSSVVIPDSVTSIEENAFYGCYSFGYIKFEKESPATVSSSNAFQGVYTTALIIVPVNCLQAYTTATNYPSSATYTYLVSGTYASGETLPTTSTDGYNLTWYATMNDARNQTNPITQGNGEEVYARGVAV